MYHKLKVIIEHQEQNVIENPLRVDKTIKMYKNIHPAFWEIPPFFLLFSVNLKQVSAYVK